MRRMMLMRNAVVPISLILLALGLALAAGSCGSRSLLPLSTGVSGNARSVAVDNLPAPPPGAEAIRRDAPYAGPYRLPHGRMVYTADTIREYGLEGLVEPGVYGPSDPDPLTALTAAAGGEKASSAPPDMTHDGWASPTTGNVKTLVLKVKWSGYSYEVPPTSFVEDKYFDTDGGNNNISVKEYYEQQSYGQLAFTGDVYPPGENAAYQIDGYNQGGSGFIELNKAQAKQLLSLADADVDFSQYDADGNGFIDSLHLVFQRLLNGQTREHVGFICNEYIYGNEMGDFTKDGVKILRAAYIDFYSICYEDGGDYPYNWWDYAPHHEHGHILGLPDLYDYGGDYAGRDNPGPDEDESNGCGFWCIMAAGIYVLPVQNLSAPLKYCLGWTDAEMVASNLKDFHLGPVNSSPNNIRRVWRDAMEGEEYFVLENNSTTGRKYIYYPPYIPAGNIYQNATELAHDFNPGLLIWHVDERVWYKDAVFDDVEDDGFGCNDHEERKFVDLEESTASYQIPLGGAGGIIDDDEYMGGTYDPWPADYNSTLYDRFAGDTTPSTDAYVNFPDTGDKQTGIIIGSIRRDGDDAVFDLSIGAPYLSFTRPDPLVQSGEISLEPAEIENAEQLDYYVNGELYVTLTQAPWGITYDSSAMDFGQLDIRVVATGTLPELTAEVEFGLIVDNTAGVFPLTEQFEAAPPAVASWASDIGGAFTIQDEGYDSAKSTGVHSATPPEYPNSLQSFAVLPLVTLPADPVPTMTLRTKYNLEDGADVGAVVVSADGFSTWETADLRETDPAEFSGYAADWGNTHVDLSPWAGQQVHIGFLLTTNGSVAGEDGGQPAGWWIDQVVIAYNWAETVPSITYTGVLNPAKYGLMYQEPMIVLAAYADNGAERLDYTLETTGGPLDGEVNGPPFTTEIDVSGLPNQRATLRLQAFDALGVGSPFIETPVTIYNFRGDVNGDGLVNAADRDALSGLLGMQNTDVGFRPWYDSNGNNEVDAGDLAAVGYFWTGP